MANKTEFREWAKNPEYPTKRGVCDFCETKDELKLSFDQIHYICIDAKTCVNRWRRLHNKETN